MLLHELKGDTAERATVKVVRAPSSQAPTLTTTVWSTLTASPARRLAMGGALTTLLVVLFTVPGLRNFFSRSTQSGSLPAAMHMAVLPFDTFGGDEEDKSFSDGLAHLVATNLLRMEHDKDELWIIPVREVLSREVTSASDARDKFGINLAVSGTIVELANTMQITLDVTDARTLRVVESETIELSETSPQAIQEQVMIKLATMLELRSPSDVENQMIAGQTDDPEAYKLYVQAEGFIQRWEIEENVDEAIRLFELAIKRDTTFALAYAVATKAYTRKYFYTKEPEHIELASARSKKALELNDSLTESWISDGRLYKNTGEYEKAVASLMKALELDPDNYDANRELAGTYYYMQKYEDANVQYEKAIAIQPNYWEGHYLLALSLGSMSSAEKADEAILAYKKAIQLSPQNHLAYNNLGVMYLNLGDTIQAEDMFLKTVDMRPDAYPYLNLGWIARSRKQFEQSLAFHEKAGELEENDVFIQFELGNAYDLAKDFSNAERVWSRVLELADEQLSNVNPNDDRVMRFATAAAARLSQFDHARAYFNRYLDLDLQSKAALYWRGLLYEYMQDRQRALEYLERALEAGQDTKTGERVYLWLDSLWMDPAYKDLVVRYR